MFVKHLLQLKHTQVKIMLRGHLRTMGLAQIPKSVSTLHRRGWWETDPHTQVNENTKWRNLHERELGNI